MLLPLLLLPLLLVPLLVPPLPPLPPLPSPPPLLLLPLPLPLLLQAEPLLSADLGPALPGALRGRRSHAGRPAAAEPLRRLHRAPLGAGKALAGGGHAAAREGAGRRQRCAGRVRAARRPPVAISNSSALTRALWGGGRGFSAVRDDMGRPALHVAAAFCADGPTVVVSPPATRAVCAPHHVPSSAAAAAWRAPQPAVLFLVRRGQCPWEWIHEHFTGVTAYFESIFSIRGDSGHFVRGESIVATSAGI